MKKNITISIILMLVISIGKSQNCNPVTNLSVSYVEDCAAHISWTAPSKTIVAPIITDLIHNVNKQTKKTSTTIFDKFDKNSSLKPNIVEYFNSFEKGANSEIYYKYRSTEGDDIYKATLSTLPGNLLTLYPNSIQCMEYINGVIYCVNYTNSNTFGTLNMETGYWTTIKPACGFDAVSLCFNPTNGYTYVTQWNGGDIGYVDLATGDFTVTASLPIGTTNTIYMAIDNDGVAYGIKNTIGEFGTINLSTGEFTYIATLSFIPAQIQNLGIDRETNELYWFAQNTTSSGTTVYTIDKTTGNLTQKTTLTNKIESFAIITSPPENCASITNLTYSVNENDVTLSWTAATGSPTGYEISFDGSVLTTVPTTSYTHSNVPEGMHTYGITALYSESCIPFGVFQTIIVGDYCLFRIEMYDSAGDGWCNAGNENPSFIRIYSDNILIDECTVPYDSYSATKYPLLPMGENVFEWFSGNSSDHECSFKIYNSTNDLIYEAPTGSMGTTGEFFKYQNNCETLPYVLNYNVYRDGVRIAEKISETSFLDNKLDIYSEHEWSVNVVCEFGGESNPEKISKDACNEIGIPEIINQSFSLIPNPATNNITISANIDFQSVDIINFLGQTMISQSVLGKQTSVDVSNLSKGIYFVRITSESGAYVKKIVKQ